MLNIERANIMTEECIQNYQMFLKQNNDNASENGVYTLEKIELKISKELIPSVKIIDRRQEDDPTYQGYYALEMLDRRKNSGTVFHQSKRVEWVKYTARNLLGDALFY